MKKFIIPSITVLLCMCLSCNKFVDIPLSPQLLATGNVFTDDNTALSAVSGVYAYMRNSVNNTLLNGGATIYGGLSSDEIYNSASNANYDPFFKHGLNPDNSVILNFWTSAYKVIYRANAITEGLEKSEGVSMALRRQLTGEMKVVRALMYFYLVNFFGDVPLVITTDYQANVRLPRANATLVYELIIKDLTEAQAGLSEGYPSAGKVRPNRHVATALLSRVYLYFKDWGNAEAQANSVIVSGRYTLVNELNNVFLINSAETLWEIAPPSNLRNTAEGTTFIPASSGVRPTFVVNDPLMSSFGSADLRKNAWLKFNTVGGVPLYYPAKYKNRTTTSITEYNIVSRFAEVILIRAEARANLGRTGDAVADLNLLRKRAGATLYPATLTQAEVFTAVEQERRLELCCEWGHRWLDLKRWGKADAVLGAAKAGWKSYEQWYPIPNQEILYNEQLKQNLGYPPR